MYDLEYAQGEGFDKHEQYAYLRKSEDELLLIVVNFDDKEKQVSVNIPDDAFHYLKQLPLPKAKAVDLLTEHKPRTIAFVPNQPITITLPAWKGAIFQITSA